MVVDNDWLWLTDAYRCLQWVTDTWHLERWLCYSGKPWGAHHGYGTVHDLGLQALGFRSELTECDIFRDIFYGNPPYAYQKNYCQKKREQWVQHWWMSLCPASLSLLGNHFLLVQYFCRIPLTELSQASLEVFRISSPQISQLKFWCSGASFWQTIQKNFQPPKQFLATGRFASFFLLWYQLMVALMVY